MSTGDVKSLNLLLTCRNKKSLILPEKRKIALIGQERQIKSLWFYKTKFQSKIPKKYIFILNPVSSELHLNKKIPQYFSFIY